MQNNLMPMTRPDSEAAVGMAYATVTGRAGKWFFLNAGHLPLERALRAESCLIAPEQGDTVLVCSGGAQGVNAAPYILAVLVRATPQQAALELPGDVTLHVDAGSLQVQAQQIALQASSEVSLQAPVVAMDGLQGKMQFHTIDAQAKELTGRFGSIRTMARSITSVAERIVQKAKDSLRLTENLDESRAGRVRLQVQERFYLKSKNATLLADQQVKIDGEKIDLG